MAPTPAKPPQDELTRLQYLTPLALYSTERPYYMVPPVTGGFGRHNLVYEFGPPENITDVRGSHTNYSLNEHGFAFRTGLSPPDHQVDWGSESEIEAGYLPWVREVLMGILKDEGMQEGEGGVRRTDVFDWRMRDAACSGVLEDPLKDRMIKIRAAIVVHIDQSPIGALDRMRRLLGEETTEELVSKYRVQVFNIWKPLMDKIDDSSLAVCDARTASRKGDFMDYELVGTDGFVRRSFLVKYSNTYKWYYMSHMKRNEVCVFRIFDSLDGRGEAGRGAVPHTAFSHKTEGPVPPRKSIEVRFFVFSEI